MSSLDEKLRAIVFSTQSHELTNHEAEEAIKQAFIDEGWVKWDKTTYTNGYSGVDHE